MVVAGAQDINDLVLAVVVGGGRGGDSPPEPSGKLTAVGSSTGIDEDDVGKEAT